MKYLAPWMPSQDKIVFLNIASVKVTVQAVLGALQHILQYIYQMLIYKHTYNQFPRNSSLPREEPLAQGVYELKKQSN